MNTAFILLIDLILAIFGYLLVPVIFTIRGKEMSLKQIKKVTIINGIVVWLILSVIISISTNGEEVANVSVVLWSYVGYSIMKKKCLKQNTDIHSENTDSHIDSLAEQQEDFYDVENTEDLSLYTDTLNTEYDSFSNKSQKEKNFTTAIVVLSIVAIVSILFNMYQHNKYQNLESDYIELAEYFGVEEVGYHVDLNGNIIEIKHGK